MKTFRRSGRLTVGVGVGVTVAVAVAGLGLAACSGSAGPGGAASPTVASLPTSTRGATGSGNGSGTGNGTGNGGSTSTTLPKSNNATKLVDEWATCMHSHGDPTQSDPVIDSHGVINIRVPTSVSSHAFGESLHNVTGPCSQYLAAAQRVLRLEFPYTPFNP